MNSTLAGEPISLRIKKLKKFYKVYNSLNMCRKEKNDIEKKMNFKISALKILAKTEGVTKIYA